MSALDSLISEHAPADSAVIKIFGVGGGGCNALDQMVETEILGVEYMCLNTDVQALAKYAPENVFELGKDITRGLGAGADPEVGRVAAEESSEGLKEIIGNADMLFLTAGMGGGTGTGAVPVVAKIAKEMGVLTVAVVTEPFEFEGDKRRRTAEAGLAELRENSDSIIVVPNENLLSYLGPSVSLVEAFAAANDIVSNAVRSIAELITTTGLINVDFADVKSVMTEMGYAIMSTGSGMGENRAQDAATSAIQSPLLKNVNLKDARGILANITAGTDLSMGEFQIVGDMIRTIAAEDAEVVVGTVIDDSLNHEIQVTVVATGLAPPGSDARKVKKEAPKIVVPAQTGPVEKSTSSGGEKSVQSVEKASADNQSTGKVVHIDNARADDSPSFAFENSAASTSTNKSDKGTVAAPDADVEVCIVCGGTADNHREKCPIPGQAKKKAVGNSRARSSSAVEAQKSSDNKGKKLSIIGLAVGVMALIGIVMYVFFGNSEVVEEYGSLKDNKPVAAQRAVNEKAESVEVEQTKSARFTKSEKERVGGEKNTNSEESSDMKKILKYLEVPPQPVSPINPDLLTLDED